MRGLSVVMLVARTVAVRDGGQIVAAWPGFRDRLFGAAADVGSTTIAVHLCDLVSGEVVASASTLDKDVKASLQGATGNAAAAGAVGRMIAERAKAAGVERVAFDRAGFKYHGRVKSLADAAREGGLSL